LPSCCAVLDAKAICCSIQSRVRTFSHRLLQVTGSVTIAKILEINAAQFTLSNTSMGASLNGKIVTTDVAVSLALDSSSKLTFTASTSSSLSLSSVLGRLWPDPPAVLSSFVSGLTFPAMKVSYTSSPSPIYTVEAVDSTTKPQPFMALGSALSISEPVASYVDSPRSFSMACTVGIPSMGISATRAVLVLQSAGDTVSMQVRSPGQDKQLRGARLLVASGADPRRWHVQGLVVWDGRRM
jgi:hypothetical protein